MLQCRLLAASGRGLFYSCVRRVRLSSSYFVRGRLLMHDCLILRTMGARAKTVAPAVLLASSLPFVSPFDPIRSLHMTASRPNISTLCKQASSIRSKLPHRIQTPPQPSDFATTLAYPSAYLKEDAGGGGGGGDHMRGFCNWIVPGLLMVGQYPGQNPENNGPTADKAREHIRSVVADAGIRTFCCLQSEVPAQDDEVVLCVI